MHQMKTAHRQLW